MKAVISAVILILVFLTGCASDRRLKEPAPERTVYDSPDLDSLH
jgi:PBP1b-binding outer membrane lipoprotein LpoB